jgi:integrase/recombinase XerC
LDFSGGDFFLYLAIQGPVLRSMTESFLKYLEFEKRVSAHTLLAYQKDLDQFRAFLLSTFEIKQPEDSDYGMVRSWIIELVEDGLEASSVNRKIASLRSFYKFLLRQGNITKDPMLKIHVLKTKKKLPSFVKENDMERILDPAAFEDSFEGWRDKLVLELFYGTGIRLSELIHLKETNVNLKNRTLKVLGKRNKERVIPFTQHLVSILEGYTIVRNKEVPMKDHGYLFVTDTGNPCYPMMIYRAVRGYVKTSEKRSPHVLRHTYATHLLNKGADLNAVKDLLGHSSLAATQVYTHNSIEKLKKAFEKAHPKA